MATAAGVKVEREVQRALGELAARVAAGDRVTAAEFAALAARVREADEEAGDERERAALVRELRALESAFATAGRFEGADAVYRLRMDLHAAAAARRFRATGEVGALARRVTFALWRFTSAYGTSASRLIWSAFNVAFWFAVLYFVIDLLVVRAAGRHAFADTALFSYGSYFIIGIVGLLPGTAAALPASYAAQVAVTVENIFGCFFIISILTLTARQLWRGAG